MSFTLVFREAETAMLVTVPAYVEATPKQRQAFQILDRFIRTTENFIHRFVGGGVLHTFFPIL